MRRLSKKPTLFGLIFIMVAVAFLVPQTKEVEDRGLKEDQLVYAKDVANEVKEVYITIFPPDGLKQKYAYTFKELNEAIDNTEDVAVKVLFQEGKEGEPRKGYYGYGVTDSNGIMKLRGQSARLAEQKSYKIELNNKAGRWQGYQIINLNKHFYDSLRMRNKLGFDLLKSLSGITSLRTNFVHLYVKDYSQGDFQQEFQDYGLFTHVENPDQDFLKNHGLDPMGQLYKVENFEFFRYPDQLRLETDDYYQEASFEEILEIKGNSDHRKLVQMLEDVNNEFIHINEVFEKHFDRENYLTWLAVNILWGNVDTNSRNFFLYSPSGSSTWYFLPWDFDKAWGAYKYATAWQEGVSNYWGVVLHQRFLKNRENLAELTAKVEALSRTFSPEKTNRLIESYQPIILKFLMQKPDNQYHSYTQEEIKREIESMPGMVEKNRQLYYKNIEKPLPVYMGKPINYGKYYVFKWTSSYDFQGDLVSYNLEISNTPQFEQLIFREVDIKDTECVVNNLPKGKYYWRLEIKDDKGNTQIPFDIHIDKDDNYYYGVQEFFRH